MSGLMAYMLDEKAGELRPVIGVVGIFLSIYTRYMIHQYGMHIRTGWNVTDYLRTRIEGMEEIWHHRYSPPQQDPPGGGGLPGFARRLMLLTAGYGLIFVALVVYFFITSKS